MSVTLLRGVMRGASDAGESPWRRLRERAEKIPGDKKHDPRMAAFSHRVIALRCSIQHKNALPDNEATGDVKSYVPGHIKFLLWR